MKNWRVPRFSGLNEEGKTQRPAKKQRDSTLGAISHDHGSIISRSMFEPRKNSSRGQLGWIFRYPLTIRFAICSLAMITTRRTPNAYTIN